MKNIHFFIYLFAVVLVMGCTKGGEPKSLGGDVYRINANASASQLVPAGTSITVSAIKGWLDQEANIFTFTLTWQDLNQGLPDTITAINFYRSADAGKNGTLFKTLKFINTNNNGSFNAGLSGATGLLSDEVKELLAGKCYYTISTVKYPEGIVRGVLSATLRDPGEKVVYPVTNLVFAAANKINLTVGEKSKLGISVEPGYATDKSLQWESSDPSIVSVDQNGEVTALKKGYVSVIAKAKDGSNVQVSALITVDLSLQNLSRAGWTVTVSSEKPSDGGGKDKIFDDNFNTYWHSSWGPDAPLPHWLLIDMQQPQDIAYVQTYRRTANTDTKTIVVEASLDGNSFQQVGTISTFTNSQGSISFFPVHARYLKLTVTESNRPPYANITELIVGAYQ